MTRKFSFNDQNPRTPDSSRAGRPEPLLPANRRQGDLAQARTPSMSTNLVGTQSRSATRKGGRRSLRAVAVMSAVGMCAVLTLLGAGTAHASTGFGIASVGVGLEPSAVAVDSSTGAVYVTNSGNGSVSFLSNGGYDATPTLRQTISIGIGINPDAVAVDPTTHNVYVANGAHATPDAGGDNSISVINMSGYVPLTGTVTANIAVATNPDAVAVDPTTHTLYVASAYAGVGTVSVIDEATNTVLLEIGVGPDPVAIAVDPTSHQVYVADRSDGTVREIYENREAYIIYHVGTGLDAVAADPTGRRFYVAGSTSSAGLGLAAQLSVIDEATEPVVNNGMQMVGVLSSVAVDPSTENVYVTNDYDGTVSVFDGSGHSLGLLSPVGKNPSAVAADPVTHNAYVANTGSNTVSVISSEVSPTIIGTPNAATVGTPYTYPFIVTGTPSPTVTSPNLPAGLQLSGGTLYGTPTVSGRYTFTVTASNALGSASDQVVNMTVLPVPQAAPTITGAPTDPTVHAAFSYQFTLTGNPSPTVSLYRGSLPPGMQLSTGGTLSGTPTAAGTSTFTLAANNLLGTAYDQVTMTVSPWATPPHLPCKPAIQCQ
jgi:YVTN family beta-propeller protein